MTQTTEEEGNSFTISKLYEDDNVLVIDKPSGILTHNRTASEEQSISAWFVKEYPKSANVGEPLVLGDGTNVLKPGIVHRLDRDTSGVLLLVKNQQAFEYIKEQFKERNVEKKYHAFVYGVVKEEFGVIDRPIGRSARDFRLKSAQRGARGTLREAVTHFKVLQRGDAVTYLELSPKTGRMHQLRVHLKALNHPIVCDSLYAPKHESVLGFLRLALHAKTLALEIQPGKKMVFEAPLPKDFVEAKNALI